jgi:hypothetical protein
MSGDLHVTPHWKDMTCHLSPHNVISPPFPTLTERTDQRFLSFRRIDPSRELVIACGNSPQCDPNYGAYPVPYFVDQHHYRNHDGDTTTATPSIDSEYPVSACDAENLGGPHTLDKRTHGQ